MKKKERKARRVIVCVTNDLVTDKRVARICDTLSDEWCRVLLVGRKLKNSPPIEQRRYKTVRFHLVFNKNFLFYANYNIRLFKLLMLRRFDIVYANDLDTLPACYLASRLKRKKLIYDSHEYFTGVPELQNRNFVKGFWKWWEQRIFPKLDYVITVNESIANLYRKEYGKNIYVVRNLPVLEPLQEIKSRSELGLPENTHLVILQGAGINVDRGAEEAIMAFYPEYGIQNAVLLFIGDGDVIPELKKLAAEKHLDGRVMFIPRQTPSELKHYTHHASIGLTLDKDTNLNYRYSLPNKLFDYIHAEVPVLATPLEEVKPVIQTWRIGETVDAKPEKIADTIKKMLSKPDLLDFYKANCRKAAQSLNWQNEQKILISVLNRLRQNHV